MRWIPGSLITTPLLAPVRTRMVVYPRFRGIGEERLRPQINALSSPGLHLIIITTRTRVHSRLVSHGAPALTQLSDSANANENANGKGTEGTYCPAIQRNTTWIWFSTSKFWHEIGFIASFCQFCGATIFWISGFSGLNHRAGATHCGLGRCVLAAASCGRDFIISSRYCMHRALYMLETQTKWYKPAWKSLGWHIGTWNFIGAIGFTLSGAFGFSTASGTRYESALSTFWGSWAFLVASVLQWYEAVNPGHDSTKTQ
ncbi:hypothetical protein K439DRAFT_821275 [Ramaria rubella]|nr:hypothetical protein K439DRAFT_821275 [Ramaria rubella]